MIELNRGTTMLVDFRLTCVDELVFCPQAESWVDPRVCAECAFLHRIETSDAGDVVSCRPPSSRVAALVETGALRDQAYVASRHPSHRGRVLTIFEMTLPSAEREFVAKVSQRQTYLY